MNADVNWFCMSALPRDWILILICLTEGVLEIGTCNYIRDNLKNQLAVLYQPNNTRYQCPDVHDSKSKNPLLKL